MREVKRVYRQWSVYYVWVNDGEWHAVGPVCATSLTDATDRMRNQIAHERADNYMKPVPEDVKWKAKRFARLPRLRTWVSKGGRVNKHKKHKYKGRKVAPKWRAAR